MKFNSKRMKKIMFFFLNIKSLSAFAQLSKKKWTVYLRNNTFLGYFSIFRDKKMYKFKF